MNIKNCHMYFHFIEVSRTFEITISQLNKMLSRLSGIAEPSCLYLFPVFIPSVALASKFFFFFL